MVSLVVGRFAATAIQVTVDIDRISGGRNVTKMRHDFEEWLSNC